MVCTAEYVAKVDSCSIITSAATASAAASAASAASTVVLMGSPPPGCAIQEHFEDAPSLAQEPALPRSQWEREMERRVASSENMLQEIHTMVLASCGVCARCFKQCRTGDGRGPGSPERGHAFPVQPAVTDHPAPVQPLPFGFYANDTAAPWPNADCINVPGNKVLGSLPRATQELMASCPSASLPLHTHIPDALRAKIWAGEFIDLSLLSKPDQLQ